VRTAATSLSSAHCASRAVGAVFVSSLLVLSGLLVGSGCAGEAPSTDPLLDQLERFAFVPEASVRIAPGVVVGNARPLLVERFETTRAQAREWLATQPPDNDRTALMGESDTAINLPITGLTLAEARALCESRGLRLLSAGAWLRCAVGRTGNEYPFGGRWVSVANTVELRLGRPVPVGSFGHGASPEGVHDLVGNVSEWVDDTLEAGSEVAWAMGGAWTQRMRPTVSLGSGGALEVSRLELDPRTRDETVGLRACADAQQWLTAHAAQLPTDAAAKARLLAIGRAWGAEAVPLLVNVRSTHASVALDWLREGAGS
jgi:hypothetical protein